MTLPLQDFPTMVKTQATAVTASCQQLLDMTVGSVTRALLEANASIGLWIQWLIMQVLAATRASTSKGADLDSWVADYGMSRMPAVAASGAVTFGRATTGAPATIAPGVLVRTGTGATDQVFVVVADPSNPSWTGDGFTIPANANDVTVRVIAQRAGSTGNVVAQTITTLGSAIPGVDTVVNQSGTGGGVDAESDDALRARFAGFLDSRSRATAQAVGFAIASVQQGLTFTIADRTDPSGATRPGHFTVTVDDGSGSPGPDLMTAVAQAVDSVRPIGATFTLRPPLVVPVLVQLHVVGPASAAVAVQGAINAYVGALPIGAPLTITRLYQIAYSADPAITNAAAALINGSGSDFQPPIFGLVRPAGVSVTN